MHNESLETHYQEIPFNQLLALQKIKRFIDKFDSDNWENLHKFVIEEYFPIGKSEPYNIHTYELFNITVDIEDDGIVYFDDAEGILEENMYNNTPLPLQAIILDKIIDANINEYYKWITISFEDGYIRIKY